jgi:hypothetical protein
MKLSGNRFHSITAFFYLTPRATMTPYFPAVAKERLSTNDQGDVIYRFKKPWDDGTTAAKTSQGASQPRASFRR